MLLIFFSAATVFLYKKNINNPLSPSDTTLQVFEIQKGDNAKTISKNLEDQNLIPNSNAFYYYSRLNKLDRQFKAGRFTISPSMTPTEIASTLTTNQQGNVVITIQEGQTVQDINESLKTLGLISNQEFIDSVNSFNKFDQYKFLDEAKTEELPIKLEGYLFPDTYFLSPSTFDSDEFLGTLLDTFESKALPLLEQSNRPVHEIITMASIVEKEAYGPTDSPIISGILWKRTDNGWFLGADATSLYLKETNIITHETLQEQNPYNTRNFTKGLPPGPIGNPGLESIQATVNPSETEYWYYLHTPSGTTHYATTNDGHNLNRARYLQ